MALHLAILTKLKLNLLTGSGHANWKLLAALLCPFALKLPLAVVPSSYSDLALSVRLFVFRLNQIFFNPDSEDVIEGRRDRRWERALRLFRERAAAVVQPEQNDSLFAVSMVAL